MTKTKNADPITSAAPPLPDSDTRQRLADRGHPADVTEYLAKVELLYVTAYRDFLEARAKLAAKAADPASWTSHINDFMNELFFENGAYDAAADMYEAALMKALDGDWSSAGELHLVLLSKLVRKLAAVAQGHWSNTLRSAPQSARDGYAKFFESLDLEPGIPYVGN